uniref:Thioredoxin domain-containing protein n=1 Tax=Entomoneis paludosa TaxID=265537 RepID=A0A7S3DPP2_9STRA|mmetsp:Transcript_26550/g.55568  ORF Transcript_26550/g.55568 Transcript_26550/m.55568 type:complete len:562 (+) Transcript_26550:136-1821(+)
MNGMDIEATNGSVVSSGYDRPNRSIGSSGARTGSMTGGDDLQHQDQQQPESCAETRPQHLEQMRPSAVEGEGDRRQPFDESHGVSIQPARAQQHHLAPQSSFQPRPPSDGSFVTVGELKPNWSGGTFPPRTRMISANSNLLRGSGSNPWLHQQHPKPPPMGEFITVSSLEPPTSSSSFACTTCVSASTQFRKMSENPSRRTTSDLTGHRNIPAQTFSANLPQRRAPIRAAPRTTGAAPKTLKRENSAASATRFLAALAKACKKRQREDEEQERAKLQKSKTDPFGTSQPATAGMIDSSNKKARRDSGDIQSSSECKRNPEEVHDSHPEECGNDPSERLGDKKSSCQAESSTSVDMLGAAPYVAPETSGAVGNSFQSPGQASNEVSETEEKLDPKTSTALLLSASSSEHAVRDFITEVVRKSKLSENKMVVVHFTASWCKACHNMEPALQRIKDDNQKAQENGGGKIEFITMNVGNKTSDHIKTPEALGDLVAQAWNVQALPTFFLWKQGQLVQRVSGTADPFRLFYSMHKEEQDTASPGTADPTGKVAPRMTGVTTLQLLE